jgi:hypothetical protein
MKRTSPHICSRGTFPQTTFLAQEASRSNEC